MADDKDAPEVRPADNLRMMNPKVILPGGRGQKTRQMMKDQHKETIEIMKNAEQPAGVGKK